MSTALTDEDKAFIRAILDHPEELTTWLVYADWLDERGDPRAEFIRLEVRRGQLPQDDPERTELQFYLRDLRKRLDPDWAAIFDRPAVENCHEAFKFKCPKQWESLAGTGDPKVRHCGTCHKQVHYCDTVAEAREHAQEGACIAVSLAVLRYPDDLESEYPEDVFSEQLIAMGDFDPEYQRPRQPRRPWWKFW